MSRLIKILHIDQRSTAKIDIPKIRERKPVFILRATGELSKLVKKTEPQK